jgi:hypothetical protein
VANQLDMTMIKTKLYDFLIKLYVYICYAIFIAKEINNSESCCCYCCSSDISFFSANFFSHLNFFLYRKIISHGLPLTLRVLFSLSFSLPGEHPAAMQHNIALCITPMSFLFTTFLLCIVIASKYRLNNVQVFNFIR